MVSTISDIGPEGTAPPPSGASGTTGTTVVCRSTAPGTARTVDEWTGLRTALIVVTWITVLGGVLLTAVWAARGGARAIGPELAQVDDPGPVEAEGRPVTSFSAGQLGAHGTLGLLTAILITYAALRDEDRVTGYVALLVALAITAIPAVMMFLTWRSGERPAVAGVDTSAAPRVEDRLPAPMVYLHGLLAAVIVAIVVVLLIVE